MSKARVEVLVVDLCLHRAEIIVFWGWEKLWNFIKAAIMDKFCNEDFAFDEWCCVPKCTGWFRVQTFCSTFHEDKIFSATIFWGPYFWQYVSCLICYQSNEILVNVQRLTSHFSWQKPKWVIFFFCTSVLLVQWSPEVYVDLEAAKV